MTTLTDRLSAKEMAEIAVHDFTDRNDRREHRRAGLESQNIAVSRWEGEHRPAKLLGQIVDLSAGGIRIRTQQKNLRQDGQIRVHLELPDYAGITPFIEVEGETPRGTREWVGWMAINRIQPVTDNESEIAGRLVDMTEMNRGMLSLYLSTQPLAA